jgi:hypothetical protein
MASAAMILACDIPLVTADEIDAFGDRDRLLGNVNTSAEYGGLEARLDHES